MTPTSVRNVATSSYSPPSPDPSGVAYLPGADRLMIVDGEVDEMAIFDGANMFATTKAGSLSTTGLSRPWSNEPVGAGYNPGNDHLFVSDDDQKEVFEVVAGSDDRFGTGDDTVTHFDTLGFGNSDPEGLDYDGGTDSLWLVDGINAEVFRVRAAADGRFGTGDDTVTHFDVGIYGARDPEGLAFDAVRKTVVVVDDSSDRIYELDRSGDLLHTINVASANMTAASGLAIAPSSGGSGGRAYYVAARGLDNNSHPGENDGRLYEIRATLPPIPEDPPPNTAPVVDAGPDRSVTLPQAAALDGSVSDDGRPDPVTSTWSQVSGPGTVTFDDAAAEDAVATFSAAGSFTLQLSASDGVLSASDTMTVTVQAAAATETVQPVLTARPSDGLVPVGATSMITGTLAPALAGQGVELQRASGSAWTTVATRSVAGGADHGGRVPGLVVDVADRALPAACPGDGPAAPSRVVDGDREVLEGPHPHGPSRFRRRRARERRHGQGRPARMGAEEQEERQAGRPPVLRPQAGQARPRPHRPGIRDRQAPLPRQARHVGQARQGGPP